MISILTGILVIGGIVLMFYILLKLCDIIANKLKPYIDKLRTTKLYINYKKKERKIKNIIEWTQIIAIISLILLSVIFFIYGIGEITIRTIKGE